MIAIRFDEPSSPDWVAWRAKCEVATNGVKAKAKAGEPVEVSDLYRQRDIKENYYFAKQGPFRGKCAYCECYIVDFQHGDVEHYRPKKGVTLSDDTPVKKVVGADFVAHPGYFWLALDWRNLLPSCTDCNQPSTVDGRKIGKHNRFPVEGEHAYDPDHVGEEKPLLLNPVLDSPESHLSVDTETGALLWNSPRGRATIDVLGLNVRDRLPQERRRVMREVKALLVSYIASDGRDQAALKELKAIAAGEGSFTLAARAILARLKPVIVT